MNSKKTEFELFVEKRSQDGTPIITEHRAGGSIAAALAITEIREAEVTDEPLPPINEGRSVSGYAHRYGNIYEYRAWYPTENLEWEVVTIREVFDSGAFNGARKERAYFRHNHDMKSRGLAHARNSSMKITADQQGLAFEANLSDTQPGNDLFTDVKSGLTTEMSFAFVLDDMDENAVQYTRISDDIVERRVRKVDEIFDVSTVDYPAFTGTSIDGASNMRSVEDGQLKELEKRNLLPGLAKFVAKERKESRAEAEAFDIRKRALQCRVRINKALS